MFWQFLWSNHRGSFNFARRFIINCHPLVIRNDISLNSHIHIWGETGGGLSTSSREQLENSFHVVSKNQLLGLRKLLQAMLPMLRHTSTLCTAHFGASGNSQAKVDSFYRTEGLELNNLEWPWNSAFLLSMIVLASRLPKLDKEG